MSFAVGEMFLLSSACVCLAMFLAGKLRKLNSGDATLFPAMRVPTMVLCQAQVGREFVGACSNGKKASSASEL